jgi:hypothetical protein
MRNIHTPNDTAQIPGRDNIIIQTDQFVEEFTDKAPEYEIGVQSDFVVDEAPPLFLVPVKNGVDFCA